MLMMNAAKCRINGSDYIGVFCTATENLVFVANTARDREKELLASTLNVSVVGLRLAGSDLVGIFAKANSNGILVSELAYEDEIAELKQKNLGINVEVLKSGLNALGCNILANDKIAIINPDYSHEDAKVIGDTLGVEVLKAKTGGFTTVGANNILTGNGLVINNRSTDEEKERLDRDVHFDSIRSTANTGGLAVGLCVAANTKGIVAGESTTGFELARIIEALEK